MNGGLELSELTDRVVDLGPLCEIAGTSELRNAQTCHREPPRCHEFPARNWVVDYESPAAKPKAGSGFRRCPSSEAYSSASVPPAEST